MAGRPWVEDLSDKAKLPEMNATQPSQLTAVPKLEFLHTQVGFNLIVDPTDSSSMLLLRDGIFEAPETDLVTRILRAGDTCIDAGCHIGYYSCLFAQLVGEKGCVYAFDANARACHNTRRNLSINGLPFTEVIQTALGDRNGQVPCLVSTDDQTGVGSLDSVRMRRESVSVHCQRLETFLDDGQIENIRLLKLGVEGAEENVLRGLGRFLAAHAIDFILLKCFDERLRLFNSSSEIVSALMRSAGYTCLEYGTNNSVGWSRTPQARTRGDCHYLFASPRVTDTICAISLAPALSWTQTHGNQHEDRIRQFTAPNRKLESETAVLKETIEKLQDDIDWLLSSIKEHEEFTKRLAAEKRASEAETKLVFEVLEAEKRALRVRTEELEAVLKGVEESVSYRMTAPLRKLRDRLAPDNTLRRKLYATLLRMCGPILRAVRLKG